MAIVQAMWVHGHSVNVENRSWVVQRTGNAGRVAATGEGWCHFAVPTPVIVADRRVKLDSVLLRFFTGDQAAVTAVHVWDGDTSLARHDGLHLSGSGRVERFGVPAQPEIQWGTGVSVLVGFGVDLPGAWIDFNSAGADYL